MNCWGCGGNHSWYSAREKKILCPNKDDPQSQANAAAKFNEFKQKKRDRYLNNQKKKPFEAIFTEVLKEVGSDDEEAIKDKLK